MPDRRSRALRGADATRGRGLEIGPLANPVALKDEVDVVYLDLYPTEELRGYYAGHRAVDAERIVDVDYALFADTGPRRLAEATAGAAPFDWVIASHVAEHVPDLVGWLGEVAEVLVDGGRLSLVIPDRRYSFDARRPATTVGQLLQAHLSGDTHPPLRAVFDHHHEAVSTRCEQVWCGGTPGPAARIHDVGYAWSLAQRAMAGEYVDCHVWLFTPQEFAEQTAVLADLGLLDFELTALQPTDTYEAEFFATLSRTHRYQATAQVRRRGWQVAPPLPETEPPAVILTPLSPRERRLIDAKRRLLTTARRRLDGRGASVSHHPR